MVFNIVMCEVPIVMVVAFQTNHRAERLDYSPDQVNELHAAAFAMHFDFWSHDHLASYHYAIFVHSFYQCNVNNSIVALRNVFFALQTKPPLDYVDSHLWHFDPSDPFDSYSYAVNLSICHF